MSTDLAIETDRQCPCARADRPSRPGPGGCVGRTAPDRDGSAAQAV